MSEEREQLAAWMIAHGLTTGHGDTFTDLLDAMDWQLKEIRSLAKAQKDSQPEEQPKQ